MNDDGKGAGIRIPSMLISKREGDRLKEYILQEQKKIKARDEKEASRRGNEEDEDEEVNEDEDEDLDQDEEDEDANDTGSSKKNKKSDDKDKKRSKDKKKTRKEKTAEEKKKEYYEGTLKMLATFNMTAPDNHVEYDIWMSSSNDKALDFIEDFAKYNERFADEVSMTPHYNFWSCKDCDRAFMDKNCFANGKYCATEKDHKDIPGKEILLENLREICIYK